MSLYNKIYMLLGCLLCCITITANLFIKKFVYLGALNMEVSVGILMFPITFLISDIICEFYSKEDAKFIAHAMLISSICISLFTYLAEKLNATPWSEVDDKTFNLVFSSYFISTAASISAGYIGQYTNIFIYKFIQKSTSGRYLWLRNNVSTIAGQTVDTFWMSSALCIFYLLSYQEALVVGLSSLGFKIVAALLDTPICYLAHHLFKKYIK